MSTSLKISANTSEVKKSLLDLSRDVRNVGKTKVSVFSDDDKKFIRTELKKELEGMKAQFRANKDEIAKLVKEQQSLEKGTKAELEARKKILEAYRQQARLAKQMGEVEGAGDVGGKGIGNLLGGLGKGGGGFGGFGKNLLGSFGGPAGLALAAAYGVAGKKTWDAGRAFVGEAPSRVRLQGMGIQAGPENLNSEQLAEAGLSEMDLVNRRAQAASRLGRQGASRGSILQQARFERAYGLEEGSMTNVATSLRSTFGGRGADVAQAKIQASIQAAGIEDGLAPYLETMTDLLSDINSNGVTNSTEMISLFAQMAKDGKRTPELIADTFKGVNQAVKGSSGEANAFFLTAFARAGIGRGRIGSTQLNLESGGLFGLDKGEIAKQNNPALVSQMEGAGYFQGVGARSGALLNQFKRSAGMREGQNISDITDLDQKERMTMLANSAFGTKGESGWQALQTLESVKQGLMTAKEGSKKLEELQAGDDPVSKRLDKINSSIAGQTTVIENIGKTLTSSLGQLGIKAVGTAMELDNIATQTTLGGAELVDSTGAGNAALRGARATRQALGGGIGESIANLLFPSDTGVPKKGNIGAINSDPGQYVISPEMLTKAAKEGVQAGIEAAEKGRKSAVIQNKNNLNVTIQNGDGSVSNKAFKR